MARTALQRFCLMALLLGAMLVPQHAKSQSVRDPGQHFFQTSFGDLRAELETARREGKRGILLVFELDECPYCKRMHDTVINQVAVQDAFREHFNIIRIESDSLDEIVSPSGQTLTERDYARLSKAYGTPYSIALNVDGTELARLPGAPINADEYLLFADYAASGAATSGSFSHYKARRRGEK
jgi:thioredoxin-related protein